MSPYRKKEIIVPVVALCAGWLLASIFYSNKADSNISLIRENSSEYKFINPILLIDNSNVEFEEYSSLKSDIERSIKDAKDDGLATDVSVYIRDLNTAKWTGVNENELYDPSSMMKVITLLAYLHIAQNDPEILTEAVAYTNTPDPGQHYKPATSLSSGMHTIRELLITMITESDNASMLILNAKRPDKIKEVFNELELPPVLSVGKGYMSAADYSRVFRTLYSSTYLSRPFSEEALRLLSKTTFNLGLAAGVEKGTVVAHKFGEHTFLNTKGEVQSRELHDCGIIYKSGSPYFLCVMTRGKEFADLENVISTISSLVSKDLN